MTKAELKRATKKRPTSPKIANPKHSSNGMSFKAVDYTPSPTVTLTLDELDDIMDFELDELLGQLFKIKRQRPHPTDIRWVIIIAVECLLLGFVLAHLW